MIKTGQLNHLFFAWYTYISLWYLTKEMKFGSIRIPQYLQYILRWIAVLYIVNFILSRSLPQLKNTRKNLLLKFYKYFNIKHRVLAVKILS